MLKYFLSADKTAKINKGLVQNVIVCLLSQTDIDLHFHLILLLFHKIFGKPGEGRSNKSLFEHSGRKNTGLSFGVTFFLINSIIHVCELLCAAGDLSLKLFSD